MDEGVRDGIMARFSRDQQAPDKIRALLRKVV